MTATTIGHELPELPVIIDYLRQTHPDTWWAGPTYRSPDGTQHCALSHIADRWGMDAMGMFEETWSTSYVIGAINDRPTPGYEQDHPKDRVLAYIEALRDGREDDVQTSMAKHFELDREDAA